MQEYTPFSSAKPIWVTGRESEMNMFVGFRAVFAAKSSDSARLRITACNLYRVYVNGEFAGCGPVAGPHEYYRVDEWDLSGRLVEGENLIAIEAAGYNVNSFYLLDLPAFVQAEVIGNGNVLASTAGEGAAFEAVILSHRLPKVPRYSFQRTFSEVYRLREGFDDWRKKTNGFFVTEPCQITEPKKLLPRHVSYPGFELRSPALHVAEGTFEKIELPPDQVWKNPSLNRIGPEFKGFIESELEAIPSLELQSYQNKTAVVLNVPHVPGCPLSLSANSWHILEFSKNLTGFIGLRVTCSEPTRFFVTFDEILRDGDVDFKRMSSINILAVEIPKGTFELESFEPYTFKYAKLIVLDGNCRVEDFYLRQYKNSDVYRASFSSSDIRLNALFDAGRETFAQNSVGIFMDCPSRERAGWLCDSFFTARVAFDLMGQTAIEDNMYENYLRPEKFKFLPDGMIPDCYPADHYNGQFIPNWALWFIIQLEEYLARGRNVAMLNALKPRVYGILNYFNPFLNEHGLLEKLESWIFIEWSHANKLVQDVNFPTNMVYAAALGAAGRLYGDDGLLRRAESIKETIRNLAFDGEFFVDNAVRENGNLTVTRNRTEVCQYYALFFEVATPQTHAKLWKTLTAEFGPKRKKTNAHPEIHFANAFIGNYLRMELLARHGLAAQMLEESVEYLLYMADRTGTLWEFDDVVASCNHGFASHIVHVLYRDILGLAKLDRETKTIHLKFNDLPLAWAEGRIPLENDAVYIRWWKQDGQLRHVIDPPAGYQVVRS